MSANQRLRFRIHSRKLKLEENVTLSASRIQMMGHIMSQPRETALLLIKIALPIISDGKREKPCYFLSNFLKEIYFRSILYFDVGTSWTVVQLYLFRSPSRPTKTDQFSPSKAIFMINRKLKVMEELF